MKPVTNLDGYQNHRDEEEMFELGFGDTRCKIHKHP